MTYKKEMIAALKLVAPLAKDFGFAEIENFDIGRTTVSATNCDMTISVDLSYEPDVIAGAIKIPPELAIKFFNSIDGSLIPTVEDFEDTNILRQSDQRMVSWDTPKFNEHNYTWMSRLNSNNLTSEFALSSVDSDSLRIGLAMTLPHCSHEKTRYYLQGVYFNGTSLTATNGQTFGLYEVIVGSDEFDNFILPMRTCKLLQSVLKAVTSPYDNVMIYKFENMVEIVIGNVTIKSKLIDGQFPEYHRVIDPAVANDRSIVFDIDSAMIKKAVSVHCRVAEIDLEAGSISIKEVRHDSISKFPMVVHDGNSFVGYNAQYLKLFATSTDAKTVSYSASSSGDSALVRILDDRFTGVIMPMRV